MIAGVLVVGLAAGFFFVQGRSQTAERTEPLGVEIASLPPLSTQGKSIRGWHDMANIPKNSKGRPLPKDQPQPDVEVKPANRYLGALGSTDVVNLNYVVVNTGNQDLVIDNVADLAVRFDAGYHPVGPGEQVVRVVWLMTNDPDTPVAEARLTATIR
jgi:hypothetical protein